MMSIAIRPATVEDAELLAALNVPVQQMHADMMPHIFKPAVVTPALIEHYQNALAGENTAAYIAEVDGMPAGYILCHIQLRPDNPFTFARQILYIDEISVNPEYRRRGCGQELIQVALKLAREKQLTRVVLDMWNFNDGAHQFYLSQGFEVYQYRMQLHV